MASATETKCRKGACIAPKPRLKSAFLAAAANNPLADPHPNAQEVRAIAGFVLLAVAG